MTHDEAELLGILVGLTTRLTQGLHSRAINCLSDAYLFFIGPICLLLGNVP